MLRSPSTNQREIVMVPSYQPARRAAPASMCFGQWIGVVVVAALVAALTAGVIVYLTMAQRGPAPEPWVEELPNRDSTEPLVIEWWIEDRAEIPVIAREYAGEMEDGEAIGEHWRTFMSEINELGLAYPEDGPPIAAMSMMGEGQSVVTYHSCFKYDWYANGQPDGLDDVVYTDIPSGRYAVTKHIGPYETIGESYAKLLDWLGETNIEPNRGRPLVEEYISDPEVTPAEELESLIAVPIQ